MKRKTLTTILICLISTVFIAGCVKDTDNNLKDKLENAAENTEEEDRDSVKSEAEKPVKEKDFSVDLTSQEGILSYLDGEWTLFDRDTGRDFGILSIQNDGSFEFTRLSDKTMGSGTLSFEYSRSKKGEGPDFFRLDFDECSKLLPAGYEPYGSEGTSGIFHVGTFGNEDYLYLEEIGNGDSVVSMNIFNTKEESELIGDWPRDWLFYRDNNVENPADMIEDDTFYAWAWETDEDGVWLQPMTEHIFETHEEYTDWKYLGGYFNETDNIGIAHYGITNSTDFEGLVNTKGWNSGYPLMMCEVTVDRDYNVTKLRDIDIVMYSSYDMGELEPEFSYNGTTFTVDGYEIDVTADAPAANAITNAKLVGDWIIIDCHINPNISTYLFYNITDGLIDYFEYQIDGANLIWQGDDLSTAVYQQYNDIYDIWGRPIGHIQEGELYELSFKDKNTIVAKCWIVDDIGREKEFTEEFEYEPCDGAVWAYYEYMLGGGRQWRRLKDMAGDATALVMVDPPEKILSRMPYPVAFEESALDKVVIVPLVDDATVTIESTMPGDIPGDKKPKETEDVEKGRAIVFDVTVPEGLPAAQITVKAPGYDSAIWDVWQISGRIPQMSTFIK